MYKEVILFLTGKLAERQLTKILENMSIPSPCKKPPEWNYRVKQLGLSVAALMTGDLILRRLIYDCEMKSDFVFGNSLLNK